MQSEVQTVTLLDRSRVSQQEHSKYEPIVEADYKDIKLLRQKIKCYDEKITQQQQTIQRQRKQNDKLKQQLKQLNQSLTTVIEKAHPIKDNKKQQNEQKKQDVTKKQLDNCKKQISIYQKEIAGLKAKLEACNVERMTAIENQLKEKDAKLEEMSNTIKLLQKSEKLYNNSDIGRTCQELTNKVNSLTEQVTFLKKKLLESKKNEETQEKNMKKKNEYILSLEMKFKDHPNKEKPQKKQTHIDETENLKLLQTVESLEHSKAILEKKFKTQIEVMKNKNKLLEEQVRQLKQKLSNKEKQLSISYFKVNQLKRKGPSQTLEPIDTNFRRSLDVQQHTFEKRKQYKGLTTLSGMHRKFDDTQHLGVEKHYRLSSMSWTWHEQRILSLVNNYEIVEGQKTIKTINSFAIAHDYKNVNSVDIIFQGFEYINSLQGYCGKFIECLKISTSRGKDYMVGSNKNTTKCKKIVYDIRSNEKPVAVMGILDNNKLSNGQFVDVLVSFGLEIKKKEVVMGKQPSHFTTYSRSGSSEPKKIVKSVTDEQEEKEINDKNIINQEM